MTNRFLAMLVMGLALLAVLASPSFAADRTSCSIEFKLEGWEAIYETASGKGKVTCTNGQNADVSLNTKGGGTAFGKVKIVHGTGTFSGVTDIGEVFGDYTYTETEAGAGEAAEAWVLTKGEVSLALAGTGEGEALGMTFGKFSITKQALITD